MTANQGLPAAPHGTSAPPDWDEADLATSVPARFARILPNLPPDHLAYSGQDGELTYEALDRQSDRLAAALIARLGIGMPGAQQAIAALLPHAASSLIGVLGILKAGHFYVPLDPSLGEVPLREILADCPPRALVTTCALVFQAQSLLDGSPEAEILAVDESGSTARAEAGLAYPAPTMLANVYFTSGSTGRPRGVIRTHAQNLFSAYLSVDDGGYGYTDRVAYLTPFAQTFSIAVFFGALLSGATLCSLTSRGVAPQALYGWLRENRITVLQCPPGTLRGLAALQGDPPALAALRTFSTSLEPIGRRDVDQLARLLPAGCKLIFRLGATEAGTFARFVLHPGDAWHGTSTPAGYAPPYKEVYIVDEAGQRVGPNVPGQICVRSRFLSAGYWNRPEETAARFLPDPEGGDRRVFLTGDLGRMAPDGLLEFLGRMDRMVKIRGFRVEPESIEAALLAHPAIRECAVVARRGSAGESRLVAYFAAQPGPGVNASDLRSFLARSLPDYMLPARFVPLDCLPRLANGKVDLPALPPPARARPALATPCVPPQTERERKVADVWAEVLDLDQVGIHDNFYELGGDSLSAMRMALAVEQLAGAAVPSELVRSPTIAALAGWCESGTLPDETSETPQQPRSDESGALRRRLRRLVAGEITPGVVVRRLIVAQALRLPYEQGVRWLGWLGGPRIAPHLFREEHARFLRLAQDLEDPAAASADAKRVSVLGNLIWLCLTRMLAKARRDPGGLIPIMARAPDRFWRSYGESVARASGSELDHFVRFAGLEHWQQARVAGRGTILVTYHGPATPVATALLARAAGLERIPTISQLSAERRAARDPHAGSGTTRDRQAGWSAAFTLEGQRILRQGGAVQIVNDVTYEDGNTVRRSIGGRSYDLKPGFAELALATGATLLPVYSSYDLAGCVHLTFQPALQPPAGATHAEQVQGLLDAYVAFVEQAWHDVPESVGWGALRRYYSRPLSTPADRTPPARRDIGAAR